MDKAVETVKPKHARRNFLGRFARDKRGVVALEFGMVAIPFLGVLCAIFETAFVYYTQAVFDTTFTNVARQVLVNQYSNKIDTATFLGQAGQAAPAGTNGYTLCGSLPSYFQCSNIRVNATSYKDVKFADVSKTITDDFIKNPTNTLDFGSDGSIVVFQAFYAMPIYLSVLMAGGSQGNQAYDMNAQESGSIIANPITGKGLVHRINSVVVFRKES